MDLLLLHLILLVWLSLGAARRWLDHGTDRILGAGALGWGNLMVTALPLSASGHGHQPYLHLGLSLGLALLTLLAASRSPAIPEPELPAAGASPWLLGAGLLSLGALAAASAQASFHFPPPEAPAVLPFNQDFITAAVLVYQPPLVCLNFVNWLGWIAVGLALHRLNRRCGAGPNAAFAATWCALTATVVLAQAAGSEPRLPAAAALLAAAGFAVDWVQRGRAASAAIAGLRAGLAAGSSFGLLALLGVAVSAGLAIGRPPRHPTWWTALPGLCVGLLPCLLGLLHVGEFSFGARLSAPAATPSGPLNPEMWLPLWQHPNVLQPPTEDTIGPGLTGLVCLLALLAGMGRFRRQSALGVWLTLTALGWLVAVGCTAPWLGLRSSAMIPAILLSAPVLALQLGEWPFRHRRLSQVLGLLLVVGSLWSAHLYLWHNARRPLRSFWEPGLALPQAEPLNGRPAAARPRTSRDLLARTAIELVSDHPSPSVRCEGLDAPEGPFPRHPLPLVRWARSPIIKLHLSLDPAPAPLRLSLSARPQIRSDGALEIFCNGVSLGRVDFPDAFEWREWSAELPVRAGENLIEMRDIPRPPQLDWRDYLERYPDVKLFVQSSGQDPEQGARRHYESHGRTEHRPVQLVPLPAVPSGSHYFLFRQLRLEEPSP